QIIFFFLMETLKLNFVGKLLTREQMKNVIGGYMPVCTWTWSGGSGCASGTTTASCSISNDPDVCQQGADNNCGSNDCCSDVDCR
ncbi:MAG: hypothetical protein ACXVJD_04325, partial [Mucilaginibacter sp.]